MLRVATFEMGNLIEPQPGLFSHHHHVRMKDGTDESVTIEYKDFDAMTLRGDAALEGVIRNAEGRPVPGLGINVAAHVRNIGAIRIGQATTGEDGAFRVENVSENAMQTYGVIGQDGEDHLGTIKLGSENILRLAPEVGMTAPDIPFTVLKDGGGVEGKGKLSDHSGKVVVIDFWATWCGPCQEPMAKMQTYAAKHPEWGDRVVLLALSIDDNRAALAEHLKAKDWNETLNAWAGEDAGQSDAATAYAIRGVPTCFIIDTRGKVAHVGHPASMDIPARVTELLKAANP